MHEKEMTSDEWPFADSSNTATITTRQVLHEGQPVLFVSHDSDGCGPQIFGQAQPGVRKYS